MKEPNSLFLNYTEALDRVGLLHFTAPQGRIVTNPVESTNNAQHRFGLPLRVAGGHFHSLAAAGLLSQASTGRLSSAPTMPGRVKRSSLRQLPLSRNPAESLFFNHHSGSVEQAVKLSN